MVGVFWMIIYWGPLPLMLVVSDLKQQPQTLLIHFIFSDTARSSEMLSGDYLHWLLGVQSAQPSLVSFAFLVHAHRL